MRIKEAELEEMLPAALEYARRYSDAELFPELAASDFERVRIERKQDILQTTLRAEFTYDSESALALLVLLLRKRRKEREEKRSHFKPGQRDLREVLCRLVNAAPSLDDKEQLAEELVEIEGRLPSDGLAPKRDWKQVKRILEKRVKGSTDVEWVKALVLIFNTGG